MTKLNVIYKSFSIVENDADSNMPRPDTRQCKYCLSCFSSRDDIIMTSCALSIIEKNQLWPTKKYDILLKFRFRFGLFCNSYLP